MRSIQQIFNPSTFQGHLKMSNYFEGWYLKHVSDDGECTFALIPGISLSSKNKHAFIQYIDGQTHKTHYFRFPISEFVNHSSTSFDISIGDNRFSTDQCLLDIEEYGTRIQAVFNYYQVQNFPKTIFSPGVMGWYGFIPTMECNHGVVSMNHQFEGKLIYNDEEKDLAGLGYIEKDWGSSFPKSWLWMQCNTFMVENLSVMFSYARIPWKNRFFMGFICFVWFRGEVFLFATYNKSELNCLVETDGGAFICLSNKNHRLQIDVHSSRSGSLSAPVEGAMNRTIKESLSSEVEINLTTHQGRNVVQSRGSCAGFEVAGAIYDFVSPKTIR